MAEYLVAAFYKFVQLTNIEFLRSELLTLCKTENIVGSILLAEEGINSTLAGKAENIQEVIKFLRTRPDFTDLECKYSECDFLPFRKLKVLHKKRLTIKAFGNILQILFN